jgi:predicted nucleotidyltransferase
MIEEIRKNHRLMEREKKQIIEQRKQKAIKAANDIAAMLKEKYCVSRVVLFGSLVDGKFDDQSCTPFSSMFNRILSTTSVLHSMKHK